ncbi:MAG: DUF58 domain-containing protein [bacterium]
MFPQLKANVFNLPKHLIRLTKKLSNRLIFGQNRSIFKGSGIEFTDIREYVQGDDPRYIDWNVSARMNKLFVRNFQEEREIPVYALIDLESSLFFGTKNKLKIELLKELLFLIIAISLRLSERFGTLITFKDEVAFFKPVKNFSQIYKILIFVENLIQDFKKDKFKYTRAGSNIEKLLKIANQYLKRTSTIFVFSSFVDIKNYEVIDKYLRVLKKTKNNEVFVFKISDPAEIQIPPVGRINLQDPYTLKTVEIEITPQLAEKFRKEATKKTETIKNICIKNGITFENFLTTDNLEIKMMEFLRKKKS